MIELKVVRGAGDRPGPDIVDKLITALPVGLARGAAEINAAVSDRKILTVDTVLLPWTMPGSLVRITTAQGSRVGKVKTFEKEYSLTQTEFRAECRMNVEVVDE